MATLATYIAYEGVGSTKTAFEHYRDIFGGELKVLTYGDMPPMEGMPFTPDPNSVAHATLELPGGTIAGGDAMPGESYAVKDTVYSMLYTLDDVEEARGYIQKMVDGGGSINMPFEPAPWGGHYGQVFDKFGVMWSFDVGGTDQPQE